MTPIGTSSEPSLVSILTGLYGVGGYTRVDDGSDEWWANLGSAGATAIAKYAGFDQQFGYVNASGLFVPLFDVPGGGPTSVSGILPGATGNPFRWADLANHSSSNYWTSAEGDNLDPGTCLGSTCVDHMVTFLITSGVSAGNYVIAFEDLRGDQHPDRDFNDLVVEVSGAAPVPEPGTVGLLVLGLVLAHRVARRREGGAR